MNTIDKMTVENVEIDEAHGLYIHIDDQTKKWIDDALNCNAKHKFPITVKVQECVKHFTLAEFCTGLGFTPEDFIREDNNG